MNEHGNWRWRTLEQVFQVSATTLSRMARNVPGAGVRSVIQALNVVWQEQMLIAQEMVSSVGSAEDTCAICLFDLENKKNITELLCTHRFDAQYIAG